MICLNFPLYINAQPNINSSSYQSSLIGSTAKSSSISFSVDPSIVDSMANDDFPIGAAYRASKNMAPDKGVTSRSVRDAALFKNISPSVVLIVTKQGLGSGTIISNRGEVLTNWHVVGNNQEVGVILKPSKDTQKISATDIVRAKVVKIDQVADLALVQLSEIPSGRSSVKLGDDSDISVGADVHAIGHPNGEAWTYTKGVISQYRNDYLWSQGPNAIKHMAPVIQTQTPINPGNSGGPLLADNGVLVGVNSFKEPKSEGMNFAVSVDEVKKFLTSQGNRIAEKPTSQVASNKKCETKEVYKGKNSDGTGEMVAWDTKCKGKADMDIIVPYNTNDAIIMRLDRNGDGKPDVVVFSEKRNYKWDLSFWDNNYDSKWDLVGWHQNGEVKPYRYEDYQTAMARK